MRQFLWKVVSLTCALSISAVSMGLAYQSGGEVEPTVAELEEMATAIAEIYETEPIANEEDIELLDLTTEEMIENSQEPVSTIVQDPSETSSTEESIPQSDQSTTTGGTTENLEESDQYSTAPLESDTSLYIPDSQDAEPSIESSEEPSKDEESSSSEQSNENQVEPPSDSEPSSSVSPPSSSQPTSSEEDNSGENEADGDTLLVIYNGNQVKMYAQNVLPFFVAAEMFSSWDAEALKAQAVASHTYIKYYNQVYGKAVTVPMNNDATNSNVVNAVNAVYNEMIYYNGSVIDAQYCTAMSSMSRNASDVYQSGSYAYLTSVASKYESYGTHWNDKVIISKASFKSKVENKWGDIGLDSISPEKWIQIVNHTADGYVDNVKIGNYTTTGWGLYNATSGQTKSAWFTVEYDSTNQQFIFTTQGYGHCVGMSQWGAQFYAKYDNWTYKQILTHYYSGTTVK